MHSDWTRSSAETAEQASRQPRLGLGHMTETAAMRRHALWLTGLPGSGKTTLATGLVAALQARGQAAVLLDGDALRSTVHADLDHSPAGRRAQSVRTARLAHAALERNVWPVVALVSPLRADRAAATDIVGRMIEIHVTTTAVVCAARDPKGLWAKAAAGTLYGLTGYDAPYEVPLSPPAWRIDGGGDPEIAVASLIEVLFSEK